MRSLAEAYRAARSPAEGGSPPELESTLALLCERGRQARPDLAVDPNRFAAHLARCGAALTDPAAVHAEDLFLVCASLEGDPAAIKTLQQECRPSMVKYLRAIDSAPAFLTEMEQSAWEALLVGRYGGPPKLAIYSGKGPLPGFVGITAQRIALTSLRRQATEARAEAEAASASASAIREPELAFLKAKYQKDFQAAIRDALEILTFRERLIYRMHLVDGLTVDRIARAYDVSQSTVSRWLAKARSTVVAEVARLLRERLDLSETNLRSILGLVLSQLDISASQILGETRPPRPTGS
jgi:RNA polymerase sigma-70 factor (ECF subfamily)